MTSLRSITLQPDISEDSLLYRDMFEHAPWGIFQSTVDGHYLRVNSALAHIYGYRDAAELLKSLTNIGRQLYLQPGRRAEFVRLMRRNGVVSGFESQVYRLDGEVLWISENCRAVYDSGGKFLYYEGTVEDITARKTAESALRTALQRAEAANSAKSIFLANMSHELRTPLNAILGFAEILKEELFGPVGDARYGEYAHDIYSSGSHLLAIINDILDLTQIEGGQMTLREDVFEIDNLVSGVLRQLSELAASQSIVLTFAPPAAPIWMNADPVRLRQIVINLVTNAIKFSPENAEVLVTLAPMAAGGIEIAVIDHGIGMTDDEIVRAVQPFQQIDNSFSRRHEGTGLGLTITKSLTEMHGGELKIASIPGQGTEIRVCLPAWRNCTKL